MRRPKDRLEVARHSASSKLFFLGIATVCVVAVFFMVLHQNGVSVEAGTIAGGECDAECEGDGGEFNSPRRGEETRGRQLAARGDNSCEQYTAVRTRHTQTLSRVVQAELTLRSSHCFVSFRTIVILTNSFHVARAMYMASPHSSSTSALHSIFAFSC